MTPLIFAFQSTSQANMLRFLYSFKGRQKKKKKKGEVTVGTWPVFCPADGHQCLGTPVCQLAGSWGGDGQIAMAHAPVQVSPGPMQH